MNNKSMAEDLDYLRALAESGEHAPLLGGRFYVLWGVLIAFAYTAHYAIMTGLIGTLNWLPFLWISIVAIGLIGQFLLLQRFTKHAVPGGGSAGNQTSIYVWQFAGIAMFALFAGLILRIAIGFGEPSEMDWSIPVVFALYSVAMGASGGMAKNKILMRAAWLSAAVFAGAMLLVGRAELYLLAAAGIAATALLPGLLLMRAEPKHIV